MSLRLVIALVAGTAWLPAQRLDPIHWSLAVEPSAAAPGAKVLARFEARMDAGWHLYSLTTPKGGPVPTTIAVAGNPALSGYRLFEPRPQRALDRNFNLETETYETSAVFLIELSLEGNAKAGPTEVTADVRYQACNDKMCIPPVKRSATARLVLDPAARAAAVVIPAGYTEFKPGPPAPAASTAPVAPASTRDQSSPWFPLVAFGLGLAAIFTPCVFPMIPITVSFFLNRAAASRAQSVAQAALFSLGIVVLFSGLGLIVTAALGPFGIVQLGSSPWVNAFIALVFLAFGLSLLGAFEITIPSGVLTRLDQAAGKGGIAGTLLMGLTFALTSFACVGPFVGTLLAASVQEGGARPAIGMVSFSSGLALPFFFLALFPAYLKRMPRSGPWLARVKIVLGFIVVAVMFKYLSNIDVVLQWNLLTRERFLAAWVVLFGLPGLYLLGLLRLEGIGKDETAGVGRLLTGAVFLIFSLSLLPGMFGARLGELDAYIPPPSASPLATESESSLNWMKNRYREALDTARRENRLILVSFTGYACTNCHWMKANMFTRPEVIAALKPFVLLELYTDGTDEASRENQKLEESRFSTIAIPYYAILTPDEKVLASFPGLTRDSGEFIKFLTQRNQAS